MMSEILKIKNSRFYTTPHTSGRTELWKKSLHKYDKQKSLDMVPLQIGFYFMIKDPNMETKVSNALIYAFVWRLSSFNLYSFNLFLL